MAQDTFTGQRGFAPTFKTSQDTPAPGANLSIQVPGNIELNGCLRLVNPTGDVCLCALEASDAIFHDTDCDSLYEPGAGEFFLGAGGGGGGNPTTFDYFGAVDEASAAKLGNSNVWWQAYADGSDRLHLKTSTPQDSKVGIYDGFNYCISNEADTLCYLTLDPNGAGITTDLPINAPTCDGSPTTATVTVSDTCTHKGVFYNGDNDAITFNLPAAAAGKAFCFNANTFLQVVTVNPDDADIIIFDGTAASAGEAIVSSGAAGEFLCLHGRDDSTWFEWGFGGTWAQETP